MQRRSFVKNIFGSIIGFAVLPTAIKEFAESVPVEVPVKDVYYVDTRRFHRGDIIVLPNCEHYVIISCTMDERRARRLKGGTHDVILKPIPNLGRGDGIICLGNAMIES